MPKREFENVEEFETHLKGEAELIFDGTENLTERPQSNEDQRNKYSGKKGTHTDLALLLSNRSTWIFYVSKYYDGKHVDMGVIKKEFPPENCWFRKFRMIFDLGFIGIEKLYDFGELVIGDRKPRKSKSNPNPELSREQKNKNRLISKDRIYVEHAIGKMKRYRILKNRCRLKCASLKNRILGIAAALWNYQLMIKC